MALPSNIAGMFSGLQAGPGGTFMQMSGAGGPLAGEADVMMISGIGNAAQVDPTAGGVPPAIPSQSLTGQLQLPVQLGKFTLPLWQWLLISLLVGGAGGYYLGRR